MRRAAAIRLHLELLLLFSQGVLKPMVMDAEGRPVAAESVLQLREATLKNLHPHADDLRASESSDDEGDGGQVRKPNKSK